MTVIPPLTLVLFGAVGSGLLIVLAVGMAYGLGRDRGLRCRSDRFDRLYVETDFSGTHWIVSDTSRTVSATVVGTMSLHQSGTRITAEGIDLDRNRWVAEGVAFRRGIHLLFVERRNRGHAVGSLHLQLDASGQTMTGMKSTWEGEKTGGAIQTVVWQRTSATDVLTSGRDVDFEQHLLATEANYQQRDHMFHPVDRLVRDVVETASHLTSGIFELHNRQDHSNPPPATI